MLPINILLVEDNEGDILLTTEAIEESPFVSTLHVIKDGQKAVEYFEHLEADENVPHLMILDVNLPRLSGHEVLAYLKRHEKFRCIPVIMLSTSSSDTDVNTSYKNHVNCYITKPYDSEEYASVIAKIQDFWINTVKIAK